MSIDGGGERERDRETDRDRETERQRDRQTVRNRQTVVYLDKIKKTHFPQSPPAFGCQPAFKRSTQMLLDPSLCIQFL